ncbi:MAG TPA: hypothetical protein VG603_08815 [Chitinophagales bacterium]|nr:hypothetical protein [Chitinophagales bacterium]
MPPNRTFDLERKTKAYFVFGAAMYLFFYRLISSSMLAQMDHPLFLYGQTETVYRLFLMSGIPQFITSNAVFSALCDISLLVFTIGFLLSDRRIFAVLFSIMVLNYFLTYNLVTGHHYHGMAGLLIISIPFWFKDKERFNLLWQGARYYLFYVFVSAALWKIFRGSVFYTDQLSNILKAQHVTLLLQNGDIFRAHLAQYLIAHPGVSHIVLMVNVLLQLSFAIGFFTRKYDIPLLILAIVFTWANFFVMSIISAELLILTLALLDWDKVIDYLIRKEVITD